MAKCEVCEVRLDDENWDRSCCNECGGFLCVECMDKHHCPDCDVQLCSKCTCKECNDEGPEYDNPPYLEPNGKMSARWNPNMSSVIVNTNADSKVIKTANGLPILEGIEATVKLLGYKVKRTVEHGMTFLTIIDPNEPVRYNECYGDDRLCKCGHPYYRHFDSYEDMAPVGCKYCGCGEFKEATDAQG